MNGQKEYLLKYNTVVNIIYYIISKFIILLNMCNISRINILLSSKTYNIFNCICDKNSNKFEYTELLECRSKLYQNLNA